MSTTCGHDVLDAESRLLNGHSLASKPVFGGGHSWIIMIGPSVRLMTAGPETGIASAGGAVSLRTTTPESRRRWGGIGELAGGDVLPWPHQKMRFAIPRGPDGFGTGPLSSTIVISSPVFKDCSR